MIFGCDSRRQTIAVISTMALLFVPFAGKGAGETAKAPPPAGFSAFPMILIEPGVFQMGSTADEPMSRIDEQVRQITITRPFWLAAHEVTQALWLAVMGDNPSYFSDCLDCPVEHVSWYRAIEFCNALSSREGLPPAYRISGTDVAWLSGSDGYRLPTEAEWEYACRAGSVTPYATGACLADDQANFDAYRPLSGCSEGIHRNEAIEVGSFPPNAWGLYDMHGNIAEWCWDWYGPYDPDGAQDPRGPQDGQAKVLRGGSWGCAGDLCRSAFRASIHPATTVDRLGVRLARSVVPEAVRP